VRAWVDESWSGALSSNLRGRQDWLLDALVKGQGTLDLCVRWGATTTFTTAARDQIAASMRAWLEGWLTYLEGDACYPFTQGVTVRIAGIAVKPGQESLLAWTERTIPVYIETDPSSNPPGEPRCPDACSFSAHPDHVFPDCPGGGASHFDYAVWLDDALPGGAAVGSGWGLRMTAGAFTSALGSASNAQIQQRMGYGFGMQPYYDWTGSVPAGGSVVAGTSMTGPPTAADGWLLRRAWKEQKALRGW
jgi:hypothetical protein